jgi:ubiquinone/menaquinone biosynthesis C-methylase UbiE
MNDQYQNQDRGGQDEYVSYYAGMDNSMAQKVALVTSYLSLQGTIADMGSGSGKGSYDFARLFPRMNIVGVDINPTSVDYSREHYQAPNLSFVQGDIAEEVFPPDTLDAIINSSVIHHVTSLQRL